MEQKKKEALDLERKRPLFFNIGLGIALSLTVLAFNWKSEITPIDVTEPVDVFEPTYTVVATKFPEPEPPKPKPLEKKQKSNQPTILVESNVVDQLIHDEPLAIDDPVEVDFSGAMVKMDDEPIEVVHVIVESMPEFPGGIEAFYKYVADEMDYPSAARRMGIEGRVYVQFIIDKDGSITEVNAVRGIGAGCDEEAELVLENAPKWIPGKQRGRAVKVRMILPITFRLSN